MFYKQINKSWKGFYLKNFYTPKKNYFLFEPLNPQDVRYYLEIKNNFHTNCLANFALKEKVQIVSLTSLHKCHHYAS